MTRLIRSDTAVLELVVVLVLVVEVKVGDVGVTVESPPPEPLPHAARVRDSTAPRAMLILERFICRLSA